MSRSYHTIKEPVIPKRDLKRAACGCCAVLPRISERKSCPGDIHPVNKRVLHGVLRMIPEEYIYGLDKFELKPRQASRSAEGYTLIGHPFGFYSLVDKSIVLYSLPTQWIMRRISPGLCATVRSWGGVVKQETHKVTVTWEWEFDLALWFLATVVHHELGHHYRHQYRRKRKPAYWTEEEMVATLHAKRLTEIFTDKLFGIKPARTTNAV